MKVKVNLVLLPTRVTSSNGEPIGNLSKEDFKILENGREQELAWFAPVDSPVDVALVMDVSGSTTPYERLLKEAAVRFVDQFGPADQLALYAVGTDVIRMQGFRSDRQAVRQAISRLKWGGDRNSGDILKTSHGQGGTLLYDGIVAVQKEFAEERRRRVILVFTDTLDAGSTTSFDTLNFLTLQGSAVLFAVMPARKTNMFAQFLKQQVSEAEKTAKSWKRRDHDKPPAGSSADKDWLLVLDLSNVHDADAMENFQQTARAFLNELSPNARVRLFDFRDRLRPLVFPAPGDAPATLRNLTPDEAANLLPLSANADFYPKLSKTENFQLRVDKILVLTDANQSGLRALLKSLNSDRRSLAVLSPEKLGDAKERESLIRLLIHHPQGALLASLPGFDRAEAMEKGFQGLARDTGGQAFVIDDASELNEIYDQIAAHIRSSYTLGYYTSAVGHHLLEVTVPSQKVVVHSRRAVIVQ